MYVLWDFSCFKGGARLTNCAVLLKSHPVKDDLRVHSGFGSAELRGHGAVHEHSRHQLASEIGIHPELLHLLLHPGRDLRQRNAPVVQLEESISNKGVAWSAF